MMRTSRQLTPEELKHGLAMLAGANHWYRLELDQRGMGQCVRWPLTPARTVMWMQPLRGSTSLPQVKLAPLPGDRSAAWQEVPVAWRPGLLRVVLLLEHNKVPGATVQRRLTPVDEHRGKDRQEHRWHYTVHLHRPR